MSHIIGKTALATARIWHHVDASGRTLGPLAANIAKVLMGKHKPIYDRGADVGDIVVVTNAREVVVTGRKSDQILYRHHSGYPGGLKEIPYKVMQQKRPDKIIKLAVAGMLPKNKLRDRRLRRLVVYPGARNPSLRNVLRRWEDGQLPGHNMSHFPGPRPKPAEAPAPAP
ncbi:60S ribosomal protein L23 [Calocera viscosa TUFC12733]|uniref:60S ribosomal protein L23 n=1 Tax=Calocera viscosa (strain TUFC12733) TaxID=1330018 RepID=A0A167QW61_CALVF|nr:60S ribosomal protein L23 [Calocera viscosa TUFC12733]